MRIDYLQVMSIMAATGNLGRELLHFTVMDNIRRGMISTMGVMVKDNSTIEISTRREARA